MNLPFAMKNSMLSLLKVFAAALLLGGSTGIASAAAVIAVEQPAGTGLTDGASTINLGSVALGSSSSAVTFTIKNTGDADLTGLSVGRFTGNTGDFSNTQPASTTVAPSGSATFTVTFTPTATGSRSTEIRISSNVATFDITVTGTGTAPEIAVEQPAGTDIADNGTKSFGNVSVGSNTSLTFTVKNTGTANLTGLTYTIDGTNQSDFTVTTAPTAPVAASGSTTFVVRFTPSSFGTRTAAIHIDNNDSNEDPFDINLTGTGLAPEIGVLGAGSTAIADGGSQGFGNVAINAINKITFTIQNTGNASLTGLSITKDGTNASDFVVSASPSTSVTGGGSTTFTVDFTPTSAGSKTAAIHIASNDADENPYDINLTGTGNTPPSGDDGFGYHLGTTPVNAFSLSAADPDVVSAANLAGDDYVQALNLGFTFYFYDKPFTSCVASTNGLITFGSSSSSYTPATIPSSSAPNGFVAPFWTDLVKGSSSNILYTTRGSAPNRVFIIEYQDMEEYNNSAARISFQVSLYEGSNAIEVQYKKVSGFSSTRNVTTGIENLAGTDGIQNTSLLQRPSAGTALLYTRPVLVDVTSKFTRTDGTESDAGTVLLGLNPTIGTYKRAYQSTQRFEAPEFLYLNKDYALLSQAGDVNESNPDNVAWYRLVNDGYAIDGQVVQGTHTFFSTTLTHDVTIVWRWRLECAGIISSSTGSGGFGNPSPVVGRQWYRLNDQFSASIDSYVSDANGGFRFNTSSYTLQDKSGATLATTSFNADNAARRTSQPISIMQPLKLVWNFTGQVRYRFDALSYAQGGGTLDGQAFIKVGSSPYVYATGANAEVWVNSGATSGSKVVVGAFYRTNDRSLTMGDFNPAPGGDLGGLGASVNTLVDALVPDQQSVSRVARTYTVTHATSPTDIHWSFQPTIYRAQVELGRSFDGQDPNPQLVPSLPDTAVLKVSESGPGTLFTTKTPPPDGSFVGMSDPLRWDRVGKALFPVRPGIYEVSWPDDTDKTKSYKVEVLTGYPHDVVRRALPAEDATGARVKLPAGGVAVSCGLTQGSTTVTCTSTAGLLAGMVINGDNIKTGTTIASVTNGTTFVISNAAVASSTAEALSAWNYDYNVTLPAIDPLAGFPAQTEDAHYRHLYDPVPARQAPTKLDISGADEWKFQDLTFADGSTQATANKQSAGVPFSAAGPGRSVLLYSYRPNSDEIADGSMDKEKLAVRVVRSKPVSVINRNDTQLVLGHHGLELGSNSTSGGAYGVIQTGAATTASINPGNKFVVDFWLNAKGLKAPSGVTLGAGTTVSGATGVTCASTAAVVPGMNITGPNIPAGTKILSVTSATSLVLSNAATANGSGLTFTANNKPVTVFTTGSGGLKVTLDQEAATATATYRGVSVTHLLPKAGASWRHYVIHAFTNTFFGVDVAVVDFYLDGQRQEKGFVTSWFPGGASSSVSSGLTGDSLRFGVDADPRSGLQLDNFRLISLNPGDTLGYLTPGELQTLRTVRELGTRIRGASPMLSFNFESAPTSGCFANQGTVANVGVGPVTGSGPYAGKWANTDLQEVATRLECTLDNAGFNGTGYVLNQVSNYNANLYDRTAEVGTWGPIFPVNHYQIFADSNKRLEVAYYENPYRADRVSNPNVAWPYVATEYRDVVFPAVGPNKDKAIYIASRIGSEGVDRNGYPQEVFDLSKYSDLQVYNQPDRSGAGFNPNEEHALAAASGRAALKVKNIGDDIPNNPPLAAFALQNDINAMVAGSGYTSDPWVLVQVRNLLTGEPEMAAYQVFKTRDGAVAFPRPSTAVVNATGSGMIYEAASNPDDAFLGIDSSKAVDFSYQFEYPVFAGDLLIPPYPLNLVVGNVAMRDARGNSLQVNGVNQRTLWRDVNSNAWVVSGNGRFFHQFFYPFRGDFYLPGAQAGTPVAWIPDDGQPYTGVGTSLNPVKVIYNSFWRSDYPKLKRGETLTYQGGEYFAETPGSKGLPALVAMGASEIVYDSATPSMVFGAAGTNRYDVTESSARIIRPLDRRENLFSVAQMGTAGFTPAAATKIFIVAERWYFKELPGSLQKRFYFDSLAEKLVLRGRLNDKESGDSNLTAGPDPLNILEPNVLTKDEFDSIRGLSSDPAWVAAVNQIYLKSQNPDAVTGGNTDASLPAKNLQGVKNKPANYPAELSTFWVKNGNTISQATSPTPATVPLDSFGVGSALVPNPSLLTRAPNGSLYVTIAENNRTELTGAPVSLHIVEIVPDRYRGAIKVIEGSDAFSERVTLQHNGDFGANTADLYYEWWIRDAGPLDVVADEVLPNGTLKQTDASGHTLWQEYIPASRAAMTDINAKHLGLHTIVFEGRPDVVLADKLVLMRYRHKDEANWKLVPFEFANASTAWKPGNVPVVSPAPFQWAGAANSPQLQADGSKRYVPQLVMGWVKRVLDRINPYEARYADFFGNESPATYSSQIQIAGAPYAGKVALNPDKNVIENTGLIELYRTVLERAEELSIGNSSNGNASDGVNQALLLAATRLSVLYELLANEAYSDAQDTTINAGENSGLAEVASYTHAFQNMEADLQHEELALLRGTDFLKSYPVYNRLFWNYAKGLGEAAYNVNYNISDANKDGFINEDDARKLYPQGHGDAWGHYVCALDMHYALLQHPGFSWKTRSELYSLMQNVLEVDYLDEKTFARLAAGKARAGRDIVRETYRLAYTQDPDGQWQGYTDGADPARAWGVSEWAHRAGQGAFFDWAVANALVPENAASATPVDSPENLDRIDRLGASDQISEVSGGLHEIQVALDEANSGVNPLGLDSDAMTFDIELDLYQNGSGGDRRSHFEQIRDRAVAACNNAVTTLNYATQSQNKLRSIADDTDSLLHEAMSQDLDFRNRLIEIFGRPYDGTIGFGKAYPEGYEGPDVLLYAYLDKTKIDQIVPPVAGTDTSTVSYKKLYDKATGSEVMNNPALINLYKATGDDDRMLAFKTLTSSSDIYRFGTEIKDLSVPFKTASRYGFQASAEWGQRTSYGRVQSSLQNMLAAEVELDRCYANYIAFLQDVEGRIHRLQSEVELYGEKEAIKDKITGVRAGFTTAYTAASIVINGLTAAARITESVEKVAADAIPDDPVLVAGLAAGGTIPTSPAIAAVEAASETVKVLSETGRDFALSALEVLNLVRDEVIAKLDRDVEHLDQIRELEGMVFDLKNIEFNDRPLRDAIGAASLNLETSRQEYFTALSEGFRLLRERESYNKALASAVQKNRYQDMIFRLSRNEAMTKYQSSFNIAARYTWLAAKAYDYETSLDPGSPAAPGNLMDRIVKERQLGSWSDGEPSLAHGGLASILAQLNSNFNVLKGQLGINNPQSETEKISLRGELFRIGPPESAGGTSASDDRWKDALKARIVPDLNTMPEFVRHCRPFGAGVQPGLVIRFSSCIEPGKNFFGNPLVAGDHSYSTANFATKIEGMGVWMDNYNAAGLSITPRGYLVPIGNDYLRTSTSAQPIVRAWNVMEQRIPAPFTLSPSTLTSPGYIPTLDGVSGVFGDIRRHGDFRMYHNNGDPQADDSELTFGARLVSRSVWNSDWMLVIPGSILHVDPATGLRKLADNITDIKLYFLTTCHQGQ